MGVMGRHSEIQIKKELEGTTGGKKNPKKPQKRCKADQTAVKSSRTCWEQTRILQA